MGCHADKTIGDLRVARPLFGTCSNHEAEFIMLSRRRPTAFAATAMLCSLVALSGCQSGSRWSSKTDSVTGSVPSHVAMSAASENAFSNRHQFYYFPGASVYRDCDEDRWLWSENGGITWITGKHLPAEFDVSEEIPFVVFLTLNTPVIEHAAIAAAFPADAAFGPATATAQGSVDFNN